MEISKCIVCQATQQLIELSQDLPVKKELKRESLDGLSGMREKLAFQVISFSTLI